MSTYNYYREFQSGLNAPKANGTFWLYAKIDFSKQNMAANDVLKLFKIKDHWNIMRGLTRTVTAADTNCTADIGITSGGQEMDIAQDPYAAGDWVIMSEIDNHAEMLTVPADGYIYFEMLETDVTSGIVEVAVEIYAGLDDAEGVGSLAG